MVTLLLSWKQFQSYLFCLPGHAPVFGQTAGRRYGKCGQEERSAEISDERCCKG